MKVKRYAALFLSVIILITASMTGCSKKDEPQAAVRGFFKCIEKSNWNSADLLCDESIFSTGFFSNSRNVARVLIDNKILLPKIMEKTRLEAAAGSEIKGNTATVRIRVSAYDLPTLLSDYMMAVMLSGNNQLNIEKIIPAMLESTETVETEVTVTLNKQEDGSWIIHSTDELADAISGGLATASVDEKSYTEEKTTQKEAEASNAE